MTNPAKTAKTFRERLTQTETALNCTFEIGYVEMFLTILHTMDVLPHKSKILGYDLNGKWTDVRVSIVSLGIIN